MTLKNKSFTLVLASLLLLWGCDKGDSTQGTDGIGEVVEVHHGIKLENMDTTVSPRENFYLYANGGYINRTEIPAEESRWGVFNELRDEADLRVRKILEDAGANKDAKPGSLEEKIGLFYKTGMDTEAIEKDGMNSLSEEMALIDNIATVEDLFTTLGTFHRHTIYGGFVSYVSQDAKNSERYIVNMVQGGTGLPDRDYYLVEDPDKQEIREKYVVYLTNLYELMGADAETAASNASLVMEMETKMAENSMGRVERRDPYKTYHLMNLEGLNELADLPWGLYFESLGLPDPGEVNVAQTDFYTGLEKLVQDYSIDQWKVYLHAVLIRNNAAYLNQDFVQTNFDFYGKVLEGTEEMKERSKRVVEHTNSALGFGIGQLYVERHFSPTAKAMAMEMVENILAIMKERLADLEWMSEETRTQAINKLNTILPKIGYPDKWRDYSAMAIQDQPYVKNVMAAREFNFQYRLDKIGKPVDKTEWGISPQTVNAYYNPSKNEIVFPAGILQAPFFDEEVDAALNYGGFGAVIGHELTHAFDDQGSKFDASGNLKNWWTEDDLKNFEERAKMVEEQYSEYTVLDSIHLNGKLTLGENIADIDGLRISYYAWKRSLGGQEGEPKDGYTPEQRFFINYGQLWSSLMRPEALKLMVNTNPHSPAQWRVNGSTSSLTEFYEAFGIQEGDGMYRAEDKRMSIW